MDQEGDIMELLALVYRVAEQSIGAGGISMPAMLGEGALVGKDNTWMFRVGVIRRSMLELWYCHQLLFHSKELPVTIICKHLQTRCVGLR